MSHIMENSSFRGISQGENLPSVSFAPFLNDLKTFLCYKSCNVVSFEFKYGDMALYLKSFV